MGEDGTKQSNLSEASPERSHDTQRIEVPQEAKLPVEEPQESVVAVTASTGSSEVPGADKVERDTWLNKNIAPLLAIMILLASFGFFVYILKFDFSETSKLKDIIILLIGIVSTLVTTVIAYYFGSSHGSSDKSKFIHKLNSK